MDSTEPKAYWIYTQESLRPIGYGLSSTIGDGLNRTQGHWVLQMAVVNKLFSLESASKSNFSGSQKPGDELKAAKKSKSDLDILTGH